MGVMDSELVSGAVHRRYEPRSSQIKDYEIGIGRFYSKHTSVKRKSKDLLILALLKSN